MVLPEPVALPEMSSVLTEDLRENSSSKDNTRGHPIELSQKHPPSHPTHT